MDEPASVKLSYNYSLRTENSYLSEKRIELVEFLGPPGAGKTTLANVLLGREDTGGHPTYTYRQVLAVPSGFLGAKTKRPNWTGVMAGVRALQVAPPLLWSSLCLGGPLCWRLKRMMRVIQLNVRWQRFSSDVDGTVRVILDQGILQALLSWHWAGGVLSDTQLERVVAQVYGPTVDHVVVCIEVPTRTAYARIASRDPSINPIHPDRQPSARLARILRDRSELMSGLGEAIRANGDECYFSMEKPSQWKMPSG
jgi:energy-coupling factor transporter ATP-binding protein EcfA2